MIIVPPLGLEDAFLESYSVVCCAIVQAMYHVEFPAVDRFDTAMLHACGCTHSFTHLSRG